MVVSYEYDSIQKTIDGYNEVIKKWSDTGKISESQRKEFTSILNNIEEEYKKYSEVIPEYAKKVNAFTVEIAKETKTIYDKSIAVMKSYINRFITVIEECKNESLVAKAALDKRKSDKIIFEDLQPKYYLGSQVIQKPEGVKITNVEGTTVSTTNSGFNYRKPTGNFWVVSPMGCNQNAEYVVAFIKIEYEFCANTVPSNQDPVTEKTYEYRLMMMRPNENVWVDAPTDILDPNSDNRWVGNFNMPVYGEYEYDDESNGDSPGSGFCIGSLPHYNNNIDDIYWNEVAFKTTDSDSILMFVFNGSKVNAIDLYLLDINRKCWFRVSEITDGLIPEMIYTNRKKIGNTETVEQCIPILVSERGNQLIDGLGNHNGFAIDIVKVRNRKDSSTYVLYMSYGFYTPRGKIRKGLTYSSGNLGITDYGHIEKCKILFVIFDIDKNTSKFNIVRNNDVDKMELYDLSYNDLDSSGLSGFCGSGAEGTNPSDTKLVYTNSCFYSPTVTSHVLKYYDTQIEINTIVLSYNSINTVSGHPRALVDMFSGKTAQTVTKQILTFVYYTDTENNRTVLGCYDDGVVGDYFGPENYNGPVFCRTISNPIVYKSDRFYGTCIVPFRYRQNVMFVVEQEINDEIIVDSNGFIDNDSVKSSIITNYQPVMVELNVNGTYEKYPELGFIPLSNSWVNLKDFPTMSKKKTGTYDTTNWDIKNGGFHFTDVNNNSQLYGKRLYSSQLNGSNYVRLIPNALSYTIDNVNSNENKCFSSDNYSIASSGGFGSVLIPAIIINTDTTDTNKYMALYFADQMLTATNRVKSKRSTGYIVGSQDDVDPYMLKSKIIKIGNGNEPLVKDILIRFRVEGKRTKNDITKNFVANCYSANISGSSTNNSGTLNYEKYDNTFVDMSTPSTSTGAFEDITVDKYNKRHIYRETISPNAIVHLELLYTTPDGLSKVIEIGKKGSFIDSGGTIVCEESLFYNITKLFGENEDTNLDNGKLTTFTTYSGIEYDDSNVYEIDPESSTIRFTKSLTQSEYYDKDDKISNISQAISSLFLPVPNFTGFNDNNTISFDIVCKLNAFGDTFFSTRKCFLNVPNMKDSRTCSFEIKLKDLQDYMDASKFVYGVKIDPLGFVRNNIRPRLYIKKITVSDKEWLGLFLFAFDNDGKSVNISSKSVYEPLTANELVGKSMTTVYNNISSSLVGDKIALSLDRVPSNVNRTKFNINSGKKEFCSGFNGYSLEIENLLIPFGTQNGDSLDYYSSFNMTDIPTDPVTGTGPDISIDFENDFYVNVFGYNETSDDQGNAVFRFDI